MQDLIKRAEKIAATLKDRGETIAVAESSAGGLIAASLLAVPGASAYFVGGTVFYTRKSIQELLGLSAEAFTGAARGLSEAGALVIARAARGRLSTTWAVAEIGASGPT